MNAATPMLLDHAGIAARIPHQGRMCLLDAVLTCSDAAIDCRAFNHRDPDHPLRADGRLGAAAGIEYAAQAMAVHGALLATGNERQRQGYLTSVRGVNLRVERLDDLDGPLDIRAERLFGDADHILYQFSLRHAGQLLLDGRAAVVLDAGALKNSSLCP